MIWLLLSLVGLAVETAFIIALGRHVTSRSEAEASSVRQPTSAARTVVPTDPAERWRPA